MLLKERCRDAGIHGDEVNNISSRETALRYIEAVTSTTSLTRPKYITVDSSKPAHKSHEQC